MKEKNDKLNCIIGDIVDFNNDENIIEYIYPRKNFLYRPLIANVDYIGILFSLINPKFDINIFQRMILNAYNQKIPIIFIISKIDLINENELKEFIDYIKGNFKDQFPIFQISTEKNQGIEQLREFILGKTITISGPSGVGKSTLINKLLGEEILHTNEISSKTSRGRHTTTESRFFKICSNTFIIDTPGFSSLEFPHLKNKKDLEKLFPEFYQYFSKCKFRDCIHFNEPNCEIKENVKKNNISNERYEFYISALKGIFNKNL